MKKLFIVIIILFAAIRCIAAPTISSTSGTFSHGESVVISGSSFGSKSTAAPLIWDNAEVGTISYNWDARYPSQCSDPLENIDYRTTAGLGRGIAQAHANSTHYIAGCHSTEGQEPNFNYNKGPNVGVGLSVSTQTYSYISYYYRHDPGWLDNTNNYKIAYFCTQYITGCFSGNGFYLSYDGSPPPFTWHTNGTDPIWRSDEGGLDPDDGWYKVEIIVYHSASGWFDVYEDGNLIDLDSGHSWTGNTYSSNFSTVMIGGYRLNGCDDCYRYFDDIYHDNTLSRVIIGNAGTLAASTIREVQIPTDWTTSSITITVNQGAFSAEETAYLYVIDSGNSESDGEPIIIGGTSSNNVKNLTVTHGIGTTIY